MKTKTLLISLGALLVGAMVYYSIRKDMGETVFATLTLMTLCFAVLKIWRSAE